MERLTTPDDAAQWCRQKRKEGFAIGFVPTMGALHDGHLSLLQNSLSQCDITIASVFVNPLQFNNRKDYAQYEKNPDKDFGILDSIGCDMGFTGSLMGFFPEYADPQQIPLLDPGIAARGLEGEFRPGHLHGVATIVERLLKTVGACTAYFGEKDFQQTLVVREIVKVLRLQNVHIEIIVCPTIRGHNGLALSSRNARLSERGLELAAGLYQALQSAADAWRDGEHDPDRIELMMKKKLTDERIAIEYCAVRDGANWTEITPVFAPDNPLEQPRGLVAAWVEGVRLIDNMAFEPAP